MPELSSRFRQRGFSLIELLLAVMLTAVLAAGIYSTFSQGLRLWKRAVEMKPDLESDIVFEKIQGDFRNLFLSGRQKFAGEKDSFGFYAFSPQDRVDSEQKYRIKVPVRVNYRFDAGEGYLLRSEKSFRAELAPPKMTGEESAELKVGGQLQACSFEYYHEDLEKKTFQWKPFWKEACAPRAVRISLRYESSNKIGYVVKIIPVPAGGCTSQETAEDAKKRI